MLDKYWCLVDRVMGRQRVSSSWWIDWFRQESLEASVKEDQSDESPW